VQDISQGTAHQPKADPCALLTSKDIQAVQGDPVQETKPSRQPGGGLVMSQCLFRTATSSKSISVAIASPGAISPRTFWQKQFHSGKAASDEKKNLKRNLLLDRKNRKKRKKMSPRVRALLPGWVKKPIGLAAPWWARFTF
jgi:hypothetical protein